MIPLRDQVAAIVNRTLEGIFYGIAAGAVWGLVFLSPELVRDFSPLQLAAGRYLAYGAFSASFVVPRWRVLFRQLGWAEWRALLWLSLLGNILYYALVSYAVQYGSVAMTSLVIGFLPVAVTLIGSRDHGAVPLRRLIPSLLLSASGILCIGWQALSATAHGQPPMLIGLLCAAGALLSWTVYAVGNSRWLVRLDHLSAHEWNMLVGIVTGGQALLLAVPAFLIGAQAHSAGRWSVFWLVAGLTAVVASIIGNAFWNRMCRLLPLTLTGQMILFETLFALLYGFLWDRRLPTTLETLAIILVVASVLSCMAAHRAPVAPPTTPTTTPTPPQTE